MHAVAGFTAYSKLAHLERVELVQSARDCLTVWTKSIAFTDEAAGSNEQLLSAVPPSSKLDSSGPSPVEIRQQSGAQASASTLQPALSASSGASKGMTPSQANSYGHSHRSTARNGHLIAAPQQADHHSHGGSASAQPSGTLVPSPWKPNATDDTGSGVLSTSACIAGLGQIPETTLPQPATTIQSHVQPLGHNDYTDAPPDSQSHIRNGLPRSGTFAQLHLDEARLDFPNRDGQQVTEDDGATLQQQQTNRKEVKPETVAFRQNFALSAAEINVSTPLRTEHVDQRSSEWMAMRDGRLTASAFANALG